MKTRISYNNLPENCFISNMITNYEGLKFMVQFQFGRLYIMEISQYGVEVREEIENIDPTKAKRIARNILINKYNVNLNNEVRPR